MANKKAQIWIETAIYTLIGLTIIAIVLSVATPQIEKARERSIIGQTSEALAQLNNEIQKVEQSEGSVKIFNLKISKGRLDIDSSNNKIRYTLENTRLEFSEEGQSIREGDIFVITEKYGKNFNVILELNLSNIEMTHESNEELKTLQGAGTPYKIRMENVGDNALGEPVHIDFSLV